MIIEIINFLSRDEAKSALTGEFIGAILYGIAIVLFLQSLDALLHPTKGMIKWGFVVHAVAMFSSLTISITIVLNQLSISLIDDRDSTNSIIHDAFSKNHLQGFISTSTTNLVSGLMFPLNQWLADGLLLHRCYVIYGMNYSVILFPGFAYLATVVLGVMYIHKLPVLASGPSGQDISPRSSDSIMAYFSMSLALNVLITLMIIARLLWHRRLIRSATGASSGVSGVYTTIAVLLIESCAPYTVAFLLCMTPTNNYLYYTSVAALTEFQVIAPFFIIVRVATQRALTSDMTTPGNLSSIHFGGQETSRSGSAVISACDSTSSMAHEHGGARDALGVGGEVIIEEDSL